MSHQISHKIKFSSRLQVNSHTSGEKVRLKALYSSFEPFENIFLFYGQLSMTVHLVSGSISNTHCDLREVASYALLNTFTHTCS